MANEVDDYGVGPTGRDEWAERSEKPVPQKGLPQRGTRGTVDLKPEGDDYYDSEITGENFYTGGLKGAWQESTGSASNKPLDHARFESNNYFNLPYTERSVGDKPQDFRGDANPFKATSNDSYFASVNSRYGKNTMEDYDDIGRNPLNKPVDERTSPPFPDGWQKEPFSVYPTEQRDSGGQSGQRNTTNTNKESQ